MLRYFGYDPWNIPCIKSAPIELGHRSRTQSPTARDGSLALLDAIPDLIPTFLLSPCHRLAAKPYVNEVLSDIKPYVSDLLSDIKPYVSDVLSDLNPYVSDVLSDIKPSVSDVLSDIKPYVSDVLSDIKPCISDLLSDINLMLIMCSAI